MGTLIYPFWSRSDRRLRALWRLLGQLVLLMFLTILFSIVLFAVAGAIRGSTPDTGTAIVAGSIGQAVAIILSVWIAARLLDRRSFRDLGFHFSRRWWIDLGFGLALGAALMTGIFLTEAATGWIRITPGLASTWPTGTFLPDLLIALGALIAVGIYEELFSRGYQFTNIAEGMNQPRIGRRGALAIAWVVTSIIFGLAHAANPNATVISTTNIVLAGLFLGIGKLLTGELAIPIGLHITWNFFQGNVYGFPVSGGRAFSATFIANDPVGPEIWTGGAFGPEAGLTGIAAMIVGSLATWLWIRRGSVDS